MKLDAVSSEILINRLTQNETPGTPFHETQYFANPFEAPASCSRWRMRNAEGNCFLSTIKNQF
jgi:hypothetical protein